MCNVACEFAMRRCFKGALGFLNSVVLVKTIAQVSPYQSRDCVKGVLELWYS